LGIGLIFKTGKCMILRKSPRLLLGLLFFVFSATATFAQNTYTQQDENLHFANGMELWEKQKYAAAREAFRKQKEQEPQNLLSIEAAYYEAIAALYAGSAESLMLAQRFVSQYPEHPKAVLIYDEIGKYHYRQKDYPKAIEYLEKVATDRLSPERRLETQFQLGCAYFTQKQYDKAIGQLAPLKKYKNTYTQAAAYYTGYSYFQKEKYAEALADLLQAREEAEFQANANYLITYIYYKQKNYDEVIRFGEGLPANTPADAYLMVGDAYFQKQNYPKAVIFFDTYRNRGGKLSGEVAYRVALAYYETTQYDKAILGFREVATVGSGNQEISPLAQNATYYLGLSYLKVENKAFALTAFEQARRATHSPEIARYSDFYFGKLSFENGRFQEAIKALRAYVQAYPRSPEAAEANELITEAYLNGDNYTEALAYIEALEARSSKVNAAYQQLAFAKGAQEFNREQYENAIASFEKSLRFPADKNLEVSALFYIGETYSLGKKYAEAESFYQRALQSSGTGEQKNKALYALGYAFYNQKKYKEAKEYFERFLQTGPTTKNILADAHLRLADCLYLLKNYNEALQQYDRALAEKVAEPDFAYFQKGVIFSIQGKESQARAELDKVINGFRNSPYYDDALFQKAQIDLEKNRHQEAIEGFSRLLRDTPKSNIVPFALLKRGVAYNNAGNPAKAIDDYKRIIEEHTSSKAASNALYGLQTLMGEAGRTNEFNALLVKYKNANPDSNTLESIEFDAAKDLYFKQSYPKAIQALTLFIQEYPRSEYVFDARYYLGESYFRTNDLDNALKTHIQVAKEQKSSSYNRALQRIAEIEIGRGNWRNVITYSRLLARNPANKREEVAAWSNLMEGYFQNRQLDSSLFFANELINNGNSNPARAKAMLFRGKVSYQRGENEKALNEFLATVNAFKDENGAEAQYLIAEILYKQKQYKQSLDKLFELNDLFRSYEQWRGRSFLLIADNYVALDERFQARATLNSIIENAKDPQLVAEAREKLKKINP
jgi:tetratricopeptide (TPR) repeat protein